MFLLIKQMCAASLVHGAIMALMPEGGVRRIANIICTSALCAMVLSAVNRFDYESYSLELANYNELEKQIINDGSHIKENISRTVIEESYETYILDKATELGLDIQKIKLKLRWDSYGYWLAESVEINHCYSAALSEYIESELGITKQRQRWIEYD